jgi:hypothetical protein
LNIERPDLATAASLRVLKGTLELAKLELEFLINATPTGDIRNTLTDCNMYVMSAADVILKVPPHK